AGRLARRGPIAGLTAHPLAASAATRARRRCMMHQAVMPRGPMGVVMGWFLETGNAEQNRVTVEAIEPPAGGAVLEVGFGPGHALQLLAAKARLALIAGVDHSKLMVATARRRLIGAPAVDLRMGKADRLPFPDESFDVAFAVNSFHQWPDPE